MTTRRGGEHDPYLLAMPPLREGLYDLSFLGNAADPMWSGAAILSLQTAIGYGPYGSGRSFRWASLDRVRRGSTRLVPGQGRSGEFLRRLETTLGPWPGRVRHGEKAEEDFDLDVLTGLSLAVWLKPEGDGMYLMHLTDIGNKPELERWYQEGACDGMRDEA